MARIEILDGFNTGEAFVLSEEALIGRSLNNNICIPDGRASRHHARIFRRGQRFYIEDLGSANGTIHRGTPVPHGTQAELHDGDEIRVCATRMVFHEDGAETRKLLADVAKVRRESGARDFGNLSVMVLGEGESGGGVTQEVNLALDAQQSMLELGESERRSSAGLKDAFRRIQALCQVSIALGSILDQDALMQRIMDCIFELFPSAERSFVLLRVRETGELLPVAARRRVERPGRTEEVAISRTIVNDVISNKRSILSRDAQADDRFSKQVSVMNLSIRSMMCAPLLVGEEILGLLQVDSTSGVHSFTEQDLQLVTGIASQAAIAVKNAQLYETVETETARRTSLQRYFSPRMVEMLMSGDVNTELGGNSYDGTIFFSDIVGFTPMSEKLAPAQVVAILNRYFTVMQKIIYDNGGNVDKFDGDAIMAFWSVPKRQSSDERMAVLTGIQMQSSLWPFNRELAAESLAPIHMGIGIHTGGFVAGNIGSEDKIEFTLIGDNVNLAARIESLAGRWQVFVSGSTYERIREEAGVIRLPAVHVKGKSLAQEVYSVRLVRIGSDEYALAIPCMVSPSGGAASCEGMLTGTWSVGSEQRVLLCADRMSAVGSRLEVELRMQECDQPLRLSGSVASATEASQGKRARYARMVLNDLEGEAACAFLRPGSCLSTGRSWEEMARE